MPAERRNLLFVITAAPGGCSTARDTLDAALAAAAFEQHVQLLFSGDGVWHLLPNQDASAIDSKDTGKMLQALHYYDIDNVYADAVSMDERGLRTSHSAIAVTMLPTDMQRALFCAAHQVVML